MLSKPEVSSSVIVRVIILMIIMMIMGERGVCMGGVWEEAAYLETKQKSSLQTCTTT